jgi:signal transduction histidine kinase/CheY-like chemotaxis protein
MAIASPAMPALEGDWSSDLSALLQQLQRETLYLAALATSAFGLAALGATSILRDPLLALAVGGGLVAIAVLACLLQRWSFLAASLLLISTLALAILAVAYNGPLPEAICMLILPVGLTTLLIAPRAGLAAAAICTAILWAAPQQHTLAAAPLRYSVAVCLWCVVGLLWLTLRPLLTSVRWAWAGYERSLAMLEKARDAGLQLRQTLQDLTHANVQLTRLNRLVDGLRQTAEDARRAKEQFVANVSHELRTPLNMIIGFAEMMLESPEAYGKRLPPTLLADLAVIHRNSQHLASLIDDVLDLSQIEAGQVALTKEWAPLCEIVAEAVQSVSPLYVSKDLRLAADVPVDLPPVYCDRTRIREVLLNLLSNAGRFTEQGGVTLRAWQQGTQLIVTVTDTGPGIHEDQIGRLFQPFHQVDASTRRRHGGSGLGLSISKRLIELHGGEMTLESTLGLGTTVRFSLPITEPAPPSSGAARWLSAEWQYVERTSKSLAPRPSVRQRLVLLDTERSLERILQRYLQHVETVPVPTLQDAIRELAAVPSQALLINGPSLSQALEVLRSCPELPFGTPAIACAVPGSTEAAQALGATGYLLKPISREALFATLKRLRITGKKILVVDDEPDARQLLRRMLAASREGYLTLAAPDGETALRLLRDERPDVVLLDLAMPGMDGSQFLAAKNQDAALQPIPVVVVSARDPAGHPIITDAVAITRAGGLSAGQLLATIEASMRLLAPGRPPDPAWSGGQSD